MLNHEYLSQINLVLLILVEQYCYHPEWSAKIRCQIANVFIDSLYQESSIDEQPTLVSLFEMLNDIPVEGEEGEVLTLADVIACRLEELQAMDSFHDLFRDLELLFYSVDNGAVENGELIPLVSESGGATQQSLTIPTRTAFPRRIVDDIADNKS
ncbi:hypothetical protein EV182_004458 [Spiromyces aspiralis]|uniref:Uncharacterized protein n=1 Tax=Spiromyces aspiralis TaxID=68401 RepID=A0ACC1HT15_9FUNG|nr:hypothetical protein EV182_004458 [Spiromyces aspiralis]